MKDAILRTASLVTAILIVSQVSSFGATSYTLANGNTSSFSVNYNGIQTAVATTVNFTPMNWTWTSASGLSTFDLLMVVNNTTAASLGGRVTGMGFSTTPDVDTDPQFKVAIADYVPGSGTTNEVFKQVDYSTSVKLPQVGNVDFCVWAKSKGGTCEGAGSGNYGVLYGTSQTSKIRITYSGSGAFSFDKFYTRYQALTGNIGSDVGAATSVVPEPSFYGLLALGVGTLITIARRRRGRTQS